MRKLVPIVLVIAILACRPSISFDGSPTETSSPTIPTVALMPTSMPTSVPTEVPRPTSPPMEKPTQKIQPNPTAVPMQPLATVYGMPLDDAFELLYAEGYSAEMIKSTSGDETWGVCVYNWENTDYDESQVCLWGGQVTTDPVIEVSLWRFTETTAGSIDTVALNFYNGVLEALGFDEVDIDGIIGKARDLLTLAQQDLGEEVYDGFGSYNISAELFTQDTYGYVYGSFVIRIW